MRLLDQLRNKLRSLLQRNSVERELAREFDFHLDQQIRENLARGMSTDDARAAALRRVGGIAQFQEQCRDMRGVSFVDHWLADVRFALRGMSKNRSFAAISILTLALGIGASTALISLANTVLLRPLPFGDPDRLAVIWEEDTRGGFPHNMPSPPNFLDWKAQNQSFVDMGAAAVKDFNLVGEGEAERLRGSLTTASFLNVLGIQPAAGRFPLAGEDELGSEPKAVISHSLWQRRFAGNANVVGRTILLNNQTHIVIGVAPAGVRFPSKDADVWVTPAFSDGDLTQRGSHYLFVVGRLKDGVAIERAGAEMKSISRRLEEQYPDTNRNVGTMIVPFREHFSGDVRLQLNLLLAAVGVVLLIACANFAHLLLSRGTTRQREIAVRAALSAGRVRVVRQLLTESVLLAGFGSVLGGALAATAFQFLGRLIPAAFAEGTALALDPIVLAATAAVAVLTGVLSGAGPALAATRLDLNDVLKQAAGRTTTEGSQGRVRAAMVVAQMALTVVLLVAAGLLLSSYVRLRGVDVGFLPEQLVTAEMPLPPAKYAQVEKRAAFYQDVLARINQLPGVASAGFVNFPPMTMKGGTNGFIIEGRTPERGRRPSGTNRTATSGYLRTLGVPLLRGRYFDDQEGVTSPRVMMINQTLANRYFPGEDPIGRRVKFGDGGPTQPWTTIVGMVGDVRQMGLDVPPNPEIYFPAQASVGGSFFWPRHLVVRTRSEVASIGTEIRRAVAAVDSDQPVAQILTMDQILDTEVATRKTQMSLIVAFSLIALVLASVGLYGVLSYAVALRTPEIGLRIALGAERSNVVGAVIQRALVLGGAGIALGLAAAFGLTRVFSSMLFEVSPADPATFVLVGAVLLTVAAAAAFVPARRAASVDPVIALHCD